MTFPVTINYHGLEPSENVESRVRTHIDKLTRRFDTLREVHVTIEAPSNHHRSGSPFQVKLDLHVPGRHLIVSHAPGSAETHDDLFVTMRDAFLAANRQLDDYTQRLRAH